MNIKQCLTQTKVKTVKMLIQISKEITKVHQSQNIQKIKI